MAIRKNTAPTRALARSLELPAVICPDVPVVRLTEGLALVGLVGLYDRDRQVLIIDVAHSGRVPR
ncbi:MAG: hypothetical protein WB823_11000 [Steroidobacteraceae bacterium]